MIYIPTLLLYPIATEQKAAKTCPFVSLTSFSVQSPALYKSTECGDLIKKHRINSQLFLANIQQIDLIMEFKAKIKSMTQYPIRGTRLFPTQILTADSNKSIHIPEEPANISFARLNNSNHVNFQDPPPEIVRAGSRHTTEFAGNRPSINRLSLDQAVKNRSISEAESSQGTPSGRFRYQQANTQPNSVQQEQMTFSQTVGRQQNYRSSAFKELNIQKIVSTQTRQQIKMVDSLTSSPFKPVREEIKQIGDSRSGQESRPNVEEAMYLEYKNKYEALESDHKRMIERFKESQRLNEARIAKLEDSLKNTRNINESLMKKQREGWKKVKYLEEEIERLKADNSEASKNSLEIQRARYEEEIRIINKDKFELKLKLIDQANSYEQSSKCKETALLELQTANNLLREEVEQLRSQKISVQKEVQSLHLSLASKDAQIDSKNRQAAYQKNVLDRQLSIKEELLHTYNLFQAQIAKMAEVMSENAMMKQQLLVIEDLQAQNTSLKEQIILQNEDIQRMREQIIRIDGQGLRLDQQNLRLNNQLQSIASIYNEEISISNHRKCELENERQELIETLEDKQSVIAQLNLARNNALLDALELKNQLKKKEDEEAAKKQEQKTKAQDTEGKLKELQILLDSAYKRAKQYQKQKAELEAVLASKQQKLAETEAMQSHLFIQIYDLQQEVDAKTTEVTDLEEQLLTLKGQKEHQLADKDREIQGLMSAKIELKIDNLESSQKSNNEINRLKRVIEQLQKDKEALMIHNIKLQEQAKQQTEQVERLLYQQIQQKIHKEANSELMKQKQEEMSSRANELKEVQQQYLELIEGQLKKIQYMNQDQDDQQFLLQERVGPALLTFSRNNSPSSSPYQSPKKRNQQDIDSSSQQQSKEDILQLNLKIQQLVFVNEALRRKVQQLTQLEQHSNILIMDKIRQFQENLEKSLLQKNDLQRFNGEMMIRVKELTDKCIGYECKIEWLEGMYKELESNLAETQEDLLISHMQFINFKLMRDEEEQEEEVVSKCEINLDVDSYNIAEEKSDTHAVEEEQIQESSLEENKSKSASRSLRQQVDEDLSCQSCESMDEQPLTEEKLKEIEKNREEILNIFNQELPDDEEFEDMDNEEIKVQEVKANIELQDLFPAATQANDEVKINILAVQSEESAGQELNVPMINIIEAKSEPPSQDQQEIIEPIPHYGIQINVISVHSEDQYSDNQQFLEEIDSYMADQQKMQKKEDKDKDEEEEIFFDCGQENENEMMVEASAKVEQKIQENEPSFDYLIGLIEKACRKVEEDQRKGKRQEEDEEGQ